MQEKEKKPGTNRYVQVKLLGEGSFGKAYLFNDTVDNV